MNVKVERFLIAHYERALSELYCKEEAAPKRPPLVVTRSLASFYRQLRFPSDDLPYLWAGTTAHRSLVLIAVIRSSSRLIPAPPTLARSVRARAKSANRSSCPARLAYMSTLSSVPAFSFSSTRNCRDALPAPLVDGCPSPLQLSAPRVLHATEPTVHVHQVEPPLHRG